MKITTSDKNGEVNGWLLPIWHVDSGDSISQVYLTTVKAGCRKGPHLHMNRCGRFTCIKGNIAIKVRDLDGGYSTRFSGEDHEFATVFVPRSFPVEIINIGDCDSYVLNMPDAPYRESDPDDWPVENWDEAA